MMKRNQLKMKAFVAVAALAIGMTSCKKKCDDPNATNYEEREDCIIDPSGNGENIVLSGNITENMTVRAVDNVTLAGAVHVKDGATITIEAGSTIKSDPNEAVAYLLIERGGKIMAEGTKDNPITFTSGESTKDRGDWGGIIINGKAPINRGTEATAEVGEVKYGGSDANDNSGTLKYVIVEYGGNQINSEKEHNGFTFNGVGAGTTLEYLQAYKGNDDGFEFFGGTVNAKYLLSIGNGDDAFDWTYGWAGKGQFWVAQQDGNIGDRGIEGDGSSKDNTATPYSNPMLSNITLKAGTSTDSQGIKLREGTKAAIYNTIVYDYPKRGIQIEHDETIKHLNNKECTVMNSIVYSSQASYDYFKYSPTNETATVDLTDAEFGNDITTNPSLTGFIGVVKAGSKSTDEIDAWFTPVTFIGAVDSSNDWTDGWSKSL